MMAGAHTHNVPHLKSKNVAGAFVFGWVDGAGAKHQNDNIKNYYRPNETLPKIMPPLPVEFIG